MKNLNDGVAWGIFPIFFASEGLGLERIGVLVAIYPLVWGTLQLATGWASDRVGRKPLIVIGMVLQGVAISLTSGLDSFGAWIGAMSLLGMGTALVYPTLLAAIGDAVPAGERAMASVLARRRFYGGGHLRWLTGRPIRIERSYSIGSGFNRSLRRAGQFYLARKAVTPGSYLIRVQPGPAGVTDP